MLYEKNTDSCIKIEVHIIDEKLQNMQFPFLCNEETNGGALFSALQCMTQCRRFQSSVYFVAICGSVHCAVC